MHQCLENSLTNSLHDHRRPALPKMILRGLFRRCAWCGGRGSFFTSWYGKSDRCQTCGIAWERGYEGYELGAATMGVFLTFGSIILWMVLSVVIGVALVPLLVVAGALAVGVPVLGYPLTYTVWQGVDLFIRAPSDDDIRAAEAWLAAEKR